jgi:hypothetical protein
MGFVRAKLHFVCNYCHEIAKIDRHEVMRALARHRHSFEPKVLEPVEQSSDEIA